MWIKQTNPLTSPTFSSSWRRTKFFTHVSSSSDNLALIPQILTYIKILILIHYSWHIFSISWYQSRIILVLIVIYSRTFIRDGETALERTRNISSNTFSKVWLSLLLISCIHIFLDFDQYHIWVLFICIFSHLCWSLVPFDSGYWEKLDEWK